jgi:hypothetical protein
MDTVGQIFRDYSSRIDELIFYKYQSFSRTRPTAPDEGAGQVVPLNNHGHIVYLTHQEKMNLNLLEGLAIGAGLGFAVVMQSKLRQ